MQHVKQNKQGQPNSQTWVRLRLMWDLCKPYVLYEINIQNEIII